MPANPNVPKWRYRANVWNPLYDYSLLHWDYSHTHLTYEHVYNTNWNMYIKEPSKSDMWDKKGNPYNFLSKPLPPKNERSFIPHICMHPPHLHASLMTNIHNVQFQILSWVMIFPLKFTSNSFSSFPHCCGITKSMKWALEPPSTCNVPIWVCLPWATFRRVPKWCCLWMYVFT